MKAIFILSTFYTLVFSQELDHGHRALRGFIVKQNGVTLPPVIENLAEVSSSLNPNEVPVYWHVLKSGGTTMKQMLGKCMNFVLADKKDHGTENHLNIIWEEGAQYVDIDTSTPQGLSRAKSLHLAQSGVVDVIITPHIFETAEIFDPLHKGRMFTMIRHPIERAISMFYYLQTATWEPSYDPHLKEMSIEDYVVSGKVEENWMTRFLVNKKTAPLGPEDVVMAREILRRKFLIGLLSRKEESMRRFARYFGWDTNTPEKQRCIYDFMKTGVNQNTHPSIDRGSKVWEYLMMNNRYDMELYMYAVQLFDEQVAELTLKNVVNF